MPFEIVDPHQQPLRPRASIHKSGKLGFNKDAMDMLELDDSSYFQVAVDTDKGPEGDMILQAVNENADKAIKAAKAGDYYYLGLRNVFERFDFDYKERKFIYDLERRKMNGKEVIYLHRRDELAERE